MPKISQNSTGGVIRFDANDFLSNLYPQYQTSVNAAPGYISNQILVETAFNPFRYLGYAAPGFNPTDLTTVSVMTGLGRNVTVASESSTDYAYVICDNERINRIDIVNKTFSNAGSWPHTITGAGAITGNDVITYNENIGSTSTPCVLYSYNDAGGAWNIGLFNTSSGAFDADWFTTIPATPITPAGKTKPHPMVIGSDDILYVGDGNKLHALDGATGANGTVEDTVLLLPYGYIITSFAKTPDYLVVFAYYSPSTVTVNPNTDTSAKAIAVFWNYLDQDPTYVVPLNDSAVTAGFEYQGSIGCFTQGAKPVQEGENRYSKLKLFNGSTFDTIQQFIGNAPIHGGVDIVDSSIQWNSDGILHCYGTPLTGASKNGLNKIGAGSGTSRGLLRTVGGTSGFQMMSSGTTTSGGAQYFKVGTFAASALMQTSAAIPQFPLGMIGKIKRIVTTYGKASNAGRTLNAYLVRQDGEALQFTSSASAIASTAMTIQTDRLSSGGTLGKFSELSLDLNWSTGSAVTDAPVVRSVDVEYENVNIIGN